jgi:hypothetical protein
MEKAESASLPWLSMTFSTTLFLDVDFANSVGKLLVAALQHLAPSRNRALIVNSFTATPDEILAEFEKQTGDTWQVEYTSIERLRKIVEHGWKMQDPWATGATLKRIWTEGGTLYEDRDNGLIGDPPMETLSDQVRKAIEQA